jgi:hypothetical protein
VTEVAEKIERARTLLASGEQLKALEILSEAVDATDEPDMHRQIYELAVQGHEQAIGLQKIHWRELMISSEAQLERPVA